MKQVLTLMHSHKGRQGSIGTILQNYNVDIINVETDPLPDPAQYPAIIAFGGDQHLYEEERYPYFAQEKAFLRQVVAQDIPFLGICLGGQLLAAALGAGVKRHTHSEFGFYDLQITTEGRDDPLFAGLPDYHRVFHWHDDTFDLPTGAALLATSADTRNQAFRYGNRAYGLQYHIELDEPLFRAWLQEAMDRVESDRIDSAVFTISEQERRQRFSIYHEHSHILLKNFLKMSNLY